MFLNRLSTSLSCNDFEINGNEGQGSDETLLKEFELPSGSLPWLLRNTLGEFAGTCSHCPFQERDVCDSSTCK